MGGNFDERALDELNLFAGGWNDADWNFDDYDAADWELWNALQENVGEAAFSSPTFHTASSPPPRLSPLPSQRHAPASRGAHDTRPQQPRNVTSDHLTLPQSTATSTPARSPRPGRTPRGEDSRRIRAETSTLAGSMRREISELGEQVSGLQNQIQHLSQSFPRHRQDPQRRRRAPTPAHTHNWLDRSTRRPSNSLIGRRENDATPSAQSSPVSDSDDFGSAIDIDDLLTNISSASEADNMPSDARRSRGSNGVVDLTIDSSPASPPSRLGGRKRSAPDSIRGQSSKRHKPAVKPESAYDAEIEQLDLTNEAPHADEELTAALVAQQNSSKPSGPLKVGQRQCIICMENFTDITITACGHVYCHECLTQALLAGEKNSESGKGNCPVCRKQVNRKAKNQVIPLAFMKRSAFRGKARRDMAVLG